VIFDPVQKRKVRGLRHLWGRALSTFAAVNLPCSVLPLFLCFSSIYQVAIGVFFGENTFRLGIRHGEADWDMLSGWLETIGRRNICQLRRLVIIYDSIDLRFHEGQQIVTPMAPYRLNRRTGREVRASRCTWMDEITSGLFEVISPSIERVFRKLSWSDSPLTVTIFFCVTCKTNWYLACCIQRLNCKSMIRCPCLILSALGKPPSTNGNMTGQAPGTAQRSLYGSRSNRGLSEEVRQEQLCCAVEGTSICR
jgi:hypothetical protein